MKKLLYLLPFVLIGLSLTPFALYKDTVQYGTSLDTLSPSHWKVIDMQISFSGSLDTAQEIDPNQPTPEPEPVSKNASFKGFPFGAYFSKSNSANTSNSQSSYSASGYSWLWAIVDVLLIIASLVISFKVNRKKKVESVASQPLAQTNSNSVAAPINQPQATTVQPNVVTPTQPAQAQPPQTVQPSQELQPTESNQNQTQ